MLLEDTRLLSWKPDPSYSQHKSVHGIYGHIASASLPVPIRSRWMLMCQVRKPTRLVKDCKHFDITFVPGEDTVSVFQKVVPIQKTLSMTQRCRNPNAIEDWETQGCSCISTFYLRQCNMCLLTLGDFPVWLHCYIRKLAFVMKISSINSHSLECNVLLICASMSDTNWFSYSLVSYRSLWWE